MDARPDQPHHAHLADRADVVVIGGGAAGLAAALMLGRSRRSVVVIDAGEPRNAPAAHMHGYLGHDGLPPSDLLAIGRDEVRSYGGEVRHGRVTAVRGGLPDGFTVETADGAVVAARRVVLATGLVDVLPDIPGIAEQWGRGVIHCPYCHGWEHRDQRIVVLATGPAGVHQTMLFRQLTERLTLVLHDGSEPDAPTARQLGGRGVTIVRERAAEVVTGATGALTGVRLANGDVLDADAVVVGARMVARADAVASLGLTTSVVANGMAEVIETDDGGATAVAGVYAAGNATNARAQVLNAAAEGAMVGATINADLAEEDMTLATRAPTGSADWDARYRDHERMWSGAPNGALEDEMADHTPGRALDVGCGEGADAIWLAARGWKVTAVDVSRVAVERAIAAGERAGVAVDWVSADVAAQPPEREAYDLVTTHYPALLHTHDDAAVDALVGAVAPGGTLLVVGHALDEAGLAHAREHGFDPADYVLPDDIASRLRDDPARRDGWVIEVDETRPRRMPPGTDSPHTHDTVLRARRLH